MGKIVSPGGRLIGERIEFGSREAGKQVATTGSIDESFSSGWHESVWVEHQEPPRPR